MGISNYIKSKNVRDILGFLGTGIASQMIIFLSSIFVIRQLGPELRGYYAFLGIVGFFLVPIFSFGFIAGLNFNISSGKYKAPEVIKSVVVVAFIRGLAIILIVLALKYFNLLGETGNKISLNHILAVILTYPLNMIKESFHRILLSDSKYKEANFLSILYSITAPVLVFLMVVVFKWSFEGVVWSFVVSNIINFLLTVYFMAQAYGKLNVKQAYQPAFVKDVFRYGIKGWIGDMAVSTNNRVDQLILSFMLPPTALGLYSICGNIGQVLWILPSSIRQVLFNRNAAMTKDADKKALTARYHAFFMITGFFITILFILSAGLLVTFLFGEQFLPAVLPLRIYLIGTGIYIGTMVLTKYFVGEREILKNTYIQIGSAVVGIITALLLIKQYGIVGAAISSTLSYAASYCLAVYFFNDRKQLIAGFNQVLNRKF